MTSLKRIEANRRNSRKSTGPKTDAGKRSSRCNAVRHGLTAETVIGALEDTEDYKAFEATITADYDAQSAVERELEHVPPRLNRGILMRRRMGESIVIDSLLGAGQCRGLIPETCVSE